MEALPIELINKIANCLDYNDFLSFKSVSRSIRSHLSVEYRKNQELEIINKELFDFFNSQNARNLEIHPFISTTVEFIRKHPTILRHITVVIDGIHIETQIKEGFERDEPVFVLMNPWESMAMAVLYGLYH